MSPMTLTCWLPTASPESVTGPASTRRHGGSISWPRSLPGMPILAAHDPAAARLLESALSQHAE